MPVRDRQAIVILGRGKLATALERAFFDEFRVIKLSREHFDATHPASVDAHVQAYSPVYVFNTVVLGGLDACAADPAAALAVNALFPLHVAKLSRSMGFTLVHFSTDSVFSDAQGLTTYVESSPAMPPNMYGYTKFGADSLISLHTGNFILYRLPVMFGPSPTRAQFLERMVDRVRAGQRLRIAADIYSHAVYSLDVAHAVREHLAQHPLAGLYHLAGAEEANLYDMVATAARLLGLPHDIEQAQSADFASLDYKNGSIHLASEKLPPLRSWRESMWDYCKAGL